MRSLLIIGGTMESFKVFRYHLINHILKRQPDLKIVCASFGNSDTDLSHLIKSDKIEWVKLGGSHKSAMLMDIIIFIKLIYIIKQLKPETLIAFNAKPIFYSGLLKLIRFGPKNCVALFEGLGFGFSVLKATTTKSFLMKKLLRLSFRNYKKWIFLNDFDKKILEKNNLFCKNAKFLHINGIGIDFQFFGNKNSALENWHKQSVGFCARFIKQKGVETVHRIATIVKKKKINIQFHMAGKLTYAENDVEENSLKRWLESGAINSIADYDDIREFYKKISILVLPTTYDEGLPAVAMESQYLGIPILLNKIPQTIKSVPPNLKANLIEGNDPEEYAKLIEKYLSEKLTYEKISKTCHDYAVKEFNSDQTNNKIYEFIKS